VAPAGSVLTGQVSGLAPAAQVRGVFGAWRLALALEDYREFPMSGATTRLHAAARRGEVRVRLTATVFDEDGEQASARRPGRPKPGRPAAVSPAGRPGCWRSWSPRSGPSSAAR